MTAHSIAACMQQELHTCKGRQRVNRRTLTELRQSGEQRLVQTPMVHKICRQDNVWALPARGKLRLAPGELRHLHGTTGPRHRLGIRVNVGAQQVLPKDTASSQPEAMGNQQVPQAAANLPAAAATAFNRCMCLPCFFGRQTRQLPDRNKGVMVLLFTFYCMCLPCFR